MNNVYDDVRSTFHGIWQRKWLSLGIAWGVCVVGWIGVAMVPNSYESHARVLVQLTDPLAQQVGIDQASRKQDIDRVRNTLTSTEHLQQVIQQTALGEGISDKHDMESAVAALSKQIKITADDSNMFAISVTTSSARLSDGENAQLAKTVVNKMIDIFRDENNLTNRGELKQTMDFLDQQLAQRGSDLQAAEQRRVAFEAKYPEAAAGGMSLIQRLESTRQQIRGLDADIAAAQSAMASLGGQMAGVPQTIAGGPNGGPRQQLAQLQSDLASMRARGMTEQHPDVIAMRNQIAALKSQVQAEAANGSSSTGVPNPAYMSLQSIRADREAQLQSLIARKTSLETDLSNITAQQAANPEVASEAQNISRDYDVLKQQYDKLLGDREALKLRSSVENGPNPVKFQIVDPASTPRKPIAPNRPLLLLVVLLAGIGAGVGVAYAAGEMRSTFDTAARLENATGIPVLGAISRTLTDAALDERARRLKYFYAASCALGGLFVVLVALEFAQRGMVA